ncbi:hypothetical protein ACFVXG_44150 [Kitasatospora sp. NPDC058162]|uniref:hypothetical protein n=1 Tax=Kitasatospora sp. NPDC058162 TaxID=3346362 RepID=UPI0036DAFDE0
MAERRYEYAPAGTLPGLLQRGRGLGARMAAEDPEAAAELVYGCIRWEWRWDRQVDDRHLYLARLIRDLELPLGPVVELLADEDEDTRDRATGVLELLVQGGSEQAGAALPGYVPDEEDPAPRRRQRPPDPCPDRDNASLLDQLRDPAASEGAKGAALCALSRRRVPEPALIPLVPALGAADGTRQLPYLNRALEPLAERAVPAAREWAVSGQEWLVWLGTGVLAAHGDESDVPLLLAELERHWVDESWCGPDGLARGLARFGPGAGGAVSLLRRFWLYTPHSYERAAYLEALAAMGSAGMDQAFTESLWDCESGARLSGVEHAPERPEVGARLRYLRDDPMEEREVREAAGRRLAEGWAG